MKSLEESVTRSLDGTDTGLMRFLPYLLQDLREIGSDPETMARLVRDHIRKENLRALDLGCGKGAVSVKLAAEAGCIVTGIDALPDFIEEAEAWAHECNVTDRCAFAVGDIRTVIKELKGFDLVILGAIGPVLGNLEVTLNSVKDALNDTGYVLLDDGYIEDSLETGYRRALRKSEFFRQIDASGFKVIQEVIFEPEGYADSNELILNLIKKRAGELSALHPQHAGLFHDYVDNQAYETCMLQTVVTGGTWLLAGDILQAVEPLN